MTFPLGASCRLLAAVFSAKRSLATVEKLSTLPSLAKTSSLQSRRQGQGALDLALQGPGEAGCQGLGLVALSCFLLSLDVTEQAEAEDDQQNQSGRDKQVVVLVCFPKLFKHC